ncbi:MAG: restriction endonuclease subunit S, partial [Bifidobacterium sp.]|nr:restriction endonuclease subunit S [Bifidobacterium sp.]
MSRQQKSQELVPQLRFKGFTGAWKQRKLGDLVKRVTRKNSNLESNLPLTISAQYGLIDQATFFDKQIASKDLSGYYLIKRGEFAYNKSYSKEYPWGAIKRLEHYDLGVVSTLYIAFAPTDGDSQYLVSYFDSTKWYKEVSKNAAEGARNHGLLNIAPDSFFSSSINIPGSQVEQSRIGEFFKTLDDLIAACERKTELLKKRKS